MNKKYEFKQGMKLGAIFFPEGGELNINQINIESITVEMQCGQMAGVPWAIVVYNNETPDAGFNLAMCEGVTYIHRGPTDDNDR